MATENVSLNLDSEVKNQAQRLFEKLGMTLDTAINIFLKQSVRENAIPFTVDDPFYSEENIRHLLKITRAVDSGQARLIRHDIVEK